MMNPDLGVTFQNASVYGNPFHGVKFANHLRIDASPRIWYISILLRVPLSYSLKAMPRDRQGLAGNGQTFRT
jgi:hypothetical protein